MPSSPTAVTVSVQRPSVRSTAVANLPSSASSTGSAGIGFGVGAAEAVGSPSAGPTYAASTVTSVASVATPLTGIAPFSTLRPSSGDVSSRVGAATWAKGTVMTISTGASDSLPVLGSTAEARKRFSPRRRSTTVRQAPSFPAMTRTSWRPGAWIVTSARGTVSPRSVYVVVSSATSVTAAAGSVTAIDGGSENRRSWNPM